MATIVVSGALANKPANGGAAWTRLSWALGLQAARLRRVLPRADRAVHVRRRQRLAVRGRALGEPGVLRRRDEALRTRRGARRRGRAPQFRRAMGCPARHRAGCRHAREHQRPPHRRRAQAAVPPPHLHRPRSRLHAVLACRRARGGSAPRSRFLLQRRREHRPAVLRRAAWRHRLAPHPPAGRARGVAGGGVRAAAAPFHHHRQLAWPAGTRDARGRRRTGSRRTSSGSSWRCRRSASSVSRSRWRWILPIDPTSTRCAGIGWHVVDPKCVVPDPLAFRRYVQQSGAEFSVAQGIYVETQSGWFSDRTVRYLASGKPAVVQDTGWSRNYPSGQGLLRFRTVGEAVACRREHRVAITRSTRVRPAPSPRSSSIRTRCCPSCWRPWRAEGALGNRAVRGINACASSSAE